MKVWNRQAGKHFVKAELKSSQRNDPQTAFWLYHHHRRYHQYNTTALLTRLVKRKLLQKESQVVMIWFVVVVFSLLTGKNVCIFSLEKL